MAALYFLLLSRMYNKIASMGNHPVHLVVRFSDTMFTVGDVVAIHNGIVKEQGAVWFGKLGQTLSQNRIDMICKEFVESVPLTERS